jgi:hypothetical protein
MIENTKIDLLSAQYSKIKFNKNLTLNDRFEKQTKDINKRPKKSRLDFLINI